MKKIYISFFLMLAVLAGCKENQLEFDPKGEALDGFNLVTPANNTTLSLNSAAPQKQVILDWSQAKTGVNAEVKYTVLFANAGAGFGQPLFSLPSDNGGKADQLTLTHQALDSILKAENIAEAASAKLDWTVQADNGSLVVQPLQARTITINRFGDGLTEFVVFSPKPDTTINLNNDAKTTILPIKWQAANPSKAGTAVTYKWIAVESGKTFESANRLLEIESANNGTATYLDLTHQQLDDFLLSKGLSEGDTMKLDWTVEATAGNFSSISEYVNSMNLIRFSSISYLYVPGAYQDWNPATADKLMSSGGSPYQGYIYFPATKLTFKIITASNWDDGINYGAGSTDSTLSATGGDLAVKSEGYYLLKADTAKLTWSATLTNWGIIGDATGSWDVDKDMTYDATAKVWKITATLEAKEIKFRANDAWTLNYGDNGADMSLEEGGSNIKIAEAGTYEITLDLSVPGNYTYTLKKI